MEGMRATGQMQSLEAGSSAKASSASPGFHSQPQSLVRISQTCILEASQQSARVALQGFSGTLGEAKRDPRVTWPQLRLFLRVSATNNPWGQRPTRHQQREERHLLTLGVLLSPVGVINMFVGLSPPPLVFYHSATTTSRINKAKPGTGSRDEAAPPARRELSNSLEDGIFSEAFPSN